MINNSNSLFCSRRALSGFKKLRKDLHTVGADEIVRRYFVLDAFDGALTTLGIIMGSYFAGLSQARIILIAGLGASAAMGVSGALGAYMSERAERARSLRELEKALFASLQDTVIADASRTAVIFITLVKALSPLSVSLVCLSPLLLSMLGFTKLATAVTASFGIAMVTLFSLGVFLGRISNTNTWINGALSLLAGVFIILLVYLIGVG